MYLRRCYRSKDGKRHGYWALVESPRGNAAGLRVVRREPQRRDHTGRDRGADRAAVWEGSPHLGAGSRHGERRERAVFEASGATLHRGHAEGSAEAVRGGITSQRLAASAGRTGGAVCPAPGGEEVFLLCQSAQRKEKEQARHERFEKRIEEGLEKIAAGCRKRKQLPVVVGQRVGRLLGQNSRAAGAFEVRIDPDADGFAKLRWKRIDRWREWARLSEGCYVLRSNVTDWSAEELWRAYMQLTEAEAAFRIQKTDLQLRPIWHQKQKRVEAHILVCFLAYALWKTLAQLCQRAGLGDEPRKVFEELADITLVDVVLPTRSGVTIRKRCISRPTEHQAILLQHLNLHLPNSLEMARV